MKLNNTLNLDTIGEKALWFNFLIKCAQSEKVENLYQDNADAIKADLFSINPATNREDDSKYMRAMTALADTSGINTIGELLEKIIGFFIRIKDIKGNSEYESGLGDFEKSYFTEQVRDDDDEDDEQDLASGPDLEFRRALDRNCARLSGILDNTSNKDWMDYMSLPKEVYYLAIEATRNKCNAQIDALSSELEALSTSSSYQEMLMGLGDKGNQIKEQLRKAQEEFKARRDAAAKIDLSKLTNKNIEALMTSPSIARRKGRNRLQEIEFLQASKSNEAFAKAVYEAGRWRSTYENMSVEQRKEMNDEQIQRMLKYQNIEARTEELTDLIADLKKQLETTEDRSSLLNRIKRYEDKLALLRQIPQKIEARQINEASGTTFIKKIITVEYFNPFDPEAPPRKDRVPDWPNVELEGFVEHFYEAIGNQRGYIKDNVKRSFMESVQLITGETLAEFKVKQPEEKKQKLRTQDKLKNLRDLSGDYTLQQRDLPGRLSLRQKQLKQIEEEKISGENVDPIYEKNIKSEIKLISEIMSEPTPGLKELTTKYFGGEVVEGNVKNKIKGLIAQLAEAESSTRGLINKSSIKATATELAKNVRKDALLFNMQTQFFTAFIIHVRTSSRFRRYADYLEIARKANLHRKSLGEMTPEEIDFFNELIEEGRKILEFYSSEAAKLKIPEEYYLPSLPKMYYISTQIRTLNYLVPYLENIKTARHLIQSSQLNFLDSYPIDEIQDKINSLPDEAKEGVLNQLKLQLQNQDVRIAEAYKDIFKPLFNKQIEGMKEGALERLLRSIELPDEEKLLAKKLLKPTEKNKEEINKLKENTSNKELLDQVYSAWFTQNLFTPEEDEEKKKLDINLIKYLQAKRNPSWTSFVNDTTDNIGEEIFSNIEDLYNLIQAKGRAKMGPIRSFNKAWEELDRIYQPYKENWLKGPEFENRIRQWVIDEDASIGKWIDTEEGRSVINSEIGSAILNKIRSGSK